MAIGISSSFSEDRDGDSQEAERLRAQVAELQARLAYYEDEALNVENGLILSLRGELTYYGGEHCAWYLKRPNGKDVYLFEAIHDFFHSLRYGVKVHDSALVTMAWHVTEEPRTHLELDENLAKMALGDIKTTFLHAYSDLTGYLWTTEKFNAGNRDLLKEMNLVAGHYLYLRAQVHKEG